MSTPSLMVWMVGSQVGESQTLEDCVIHGVYTTEMKAVMRVMMMQTSNPDDAYAIAVIPMDELVNLGFTVNARWKWYLPNGVSSVSSDNIAPLLSSDHHVGVSAPDNVMKRRKSSTYTVLPECASVPSVLGTQIDSR